jgi:hypothetical protein
VSCAISEVTSNESVDGGGDGNTSPDWTITGDLTVDLRGGALGERRRARVHDHGALHRRLENAATAPVEVHVPHYR